MKHINKEIRFKDNLCPLTSIESDLVLCSFFTCSLVIDLNIYIEIEDMILRAVQSKCRPFLAHMMEHSLNDLTIEILLFRFPTFISWLT